MALPRKEHIPRILGLGVNHKSIPAIFSLIP